MNAPVALEGGPQITSCSNPVYSAAILALTRKELLAVRELVAA